MSILRISQAHADDNEKSYDMQISKEAPMVRIEIQDQFGYWHAYSNVSNAPSSITQGLRTALKAQLAQKSKKVRAVDVRTGQLIDILQG